MRFCKQSIWCVVSFVSYHLLLSGAESSQVPSDELDETCIGPDCASEATQVPSLLQKTKSQVASTVLPEDDDLTDEMAADLVMKELSKIGEMHEFEVKKTLAHNRQRLMLEEDELAASLIIDKDDDAIFSDKISFTPPFPTTGYAGHFGKSGKKGTSAVVYYKIDDKFIYLAMASNWGFVGAGMNGRNPSMRNADIVVCRDWSGDKTVTARDFHATGNKAPTPDGAEDWILTSSGIDGAITWCVMHRARVTCEIWEDYQAYNDDTTLFGLVAWSNAGAVNDELSYHGYHQRDVMAFNFMGAASVLKREFPPDSKELKVEAPKCRVPTQAGSYICSYHILKVPAHKKHHIIQWRAIWDKASPAKKAKVQHHMDLNACNTDLPVPDGALVDCTLGMANCGEVILTGVSQYSDDGDWMDDDAGIAIGGDTTVKMLFSIHFYNPSNKGGIEDKGTRFLIRYTDKLRPNNFMMFIMTTSQIEIPAKTNEHIIPSYCTAECTERLIGTTEIRFVGYHMHRAGLRTGVRVVRDGHEIEPIYTVDPWDDAMSAARVKRTIVPGDNLLGECVYTNSDNRIIPYGPELENEMCVITLSIVGPGSMKMCADLHLGQQTAPDPCKIIKNGQWTGAYRPWPVCAVGVPMTFCPDAQNKAGEKGAKPMLDTAAGHSLKFVPWGKKKRRDCVGPSPSRDLVPAQAGSCSHAATMKGGPGDKFPKKSPGGRTDTCKEDATTHAVTEPNVIVGEMDIGNDMKVSWHTNCNKKEIDFIVEVKHANEPGWLALGLINGGDATNPLGKSPNSMQGTDIVMLQPAGTGSIKDAHGVGYVPPHAKPNPTATYIGGGRQCGYTFARFRRPFQSSSPEQLELKEDGFVYLIAAYNLKSPNWEQKHDKAQALRLKTSLFGGRGESYRKKDSEVEPESEPEPESEAEKKANKPIFSGKCPKPGKTMSDCWAWAGNAGFVFTSSKQIKKKKFPPGCFFNSANTILSLNIHKKASGKCTPDWGCICESKHPEPEPEPESEVPFAVQAGMCDKVFREDQCLKAAQKVFGKDADTKIKTTSTLHWPKGCFVKSDGKVRYNTQTDSTVECAHAKVKACVCPVDIKKITKAPAPAPEPAPGGGSEPTVAYKDTHTHCVASNVVSADECKEKAEEYIKTHNLGFTIKKFKTFASSKWPEGCWILEKKKKVFFNTNTASTVKCGNGGAWCMCKASFIVTKKPAECTHVITTADECQDAALSQGYDMKVIVRPYKKKMPAGCWIRKGKLFFANGNNIAKCGSKKTSCICEK